MGAADSKPAQLEDGITAVSRRQRDREELDPSLERLRSLKLSIPLLPASAERAMREPGITKEGIRPPAVDPATLKLDSSTTSEVLKVYKAWQDAAADRINRNQEDIHLKIDAVEALAIKILQCLNDSIGPTNTCAAHLGEAHALQEAMANVSHELIKVTEQYEALFRRMKASGLLPGEPNTTPSGNCPLTPQASSGSSSESSAGDGKLAPPPPI